MTHGNGVVTSYNYDAASQLTRLAHQLGATTINSFDYTYDRVGNRTARTDRNGVANYTYDTLNRLVQAVNPLPSNPLETYTYDPVGNRTNSNQNGPSVFNQANQLTEDSNFTYQYDANGNLTRKTTRVGGAFTNYEYDAENKLVRVVTPGRTVNYKYDGIGRRIEKEIIEVTTTVRRYVYDAEDILLELDGSNNITARYTHGLGIDEPLILEKGGQSFFYHADGLASINELTNQSGTTVQRYTYSSFGKIESQLDPNFIQPYTFTAREFDPETGLYFYRARYYDPSIGRFLQEDPIRFLSGNLNLYVYVGNNPIIFTDPNGFVRVRVRQLLNATLGIVTNSLGLLAGFGAALLPDPTLLTKVAAVAIVGKSSAGLTLNVQNFISAFDECGEDLPSSLANAIADLVAPSNEIVRKLSDVVDLTIDLVFLFGVRRSIDAAVGVSLGPPGTIGAVVTRAGLKDPTDVGRVGNAFIATAVIQTLYNDAIKR